MKKLILLLVCFSLALVSSAQQYTIKAHITGLANGKIFYLKDLDADADIDSTAIQNDEFILKGKLSDTPQSLWLYCRDGNKYYYTTLLIGNEALNISGDVKDFPFDLSITGSKTQDDVNFLYTQIKEGYKKRDKLLAEYFALKGDSAEIKGKRIWKVIGKIDSNDNAIRKTFIKNRLNSYEALSELFYLKGAFPKDSLQKMYSSLTPEFKQNRFGQRINNYLKIGDILKEGDQAANFEAVDKNGGKHYLSDTKGKYVLLDFSTTYCGPCMESLEDLKIISTKYANQVEIVSFSGDGGKATWLKGLNRDKPTWLSLWDGKGSYGETILKYGITGYPSFFLVDPQGKIVAKWVGYGKDPGKKGSVETKMDELLTKK